MSIVDNADAIYFMSEPHGSQGPETAIPHDTTGLLCPTLNASAFIGPGFRDVMPIKETEDRVALFFRVLQWAADIACTSVFLETVRDRDNLVLGYRAWIPMDSIAVIEYQRVVTDSLIGAEVEETQAQPKRRKVVTDPPTRASVAAITTLKQIGDILRTMYADLSFGASGTLSMDLGGSPNSLFYLLSPSKIFSAQSNETCTFQRELSNYIVNDKFACPEYLLESGDIRSLRFGFKGGQGINSAEELRLKWARPDVRPDRKLIEAHLTSLLRLGGDFKTDVSLLRFEDLMPNEFPSETSADAIRPDYDGPTFETPLAFYAPIAVPVTDPSNPNRKVSRAMYPVQFATEEINLKRVAQAAEAGNTNALMKAFSKLAGDNNFLHGRSEATGGVPLRYHECRKEHAAIERRLEDLAQPEDKELAAMWECHGSGTPASQTLHTMSKNSMACLGLTQEQAEVFVLLSVLACGLTKHEYAWQPFTILVGPPGGGKSEGIGNVADCLPGSMVRHVDNNSRCADLVPEPEDDMTFRVRMFNPIGFTMDSTLTKHSLQVQDELGALITGQTPADKAKTNELLSKLARGWIVTARAGIHPETKKLFKYRECISNRECFVGCTNEAPAMGKSALVDRALLICFATRNGARENGPGMVANKSTQLALSKRPVFETWMKYLHCKVAHYWSIQAAGGIEINTENGSILEKIRVAKGAKGISSPRLYNYKERIATILMVLDVITMWYRMGIGKRYNYNEAAYVFFCRCFSTVAVHHFVMADLMVQKATQMETERRDVLMGLKMCAKLEESLLAIDGEYVVLTCRLMNACRAITPATPNLGDGVRQHNVNELQREARRGMPILDEYEGAIGTPKLKLLLTVANEVLIPSQRIILEELYRLFRDTVNPKWSWRWEDDLNHNKFVVFKPSIKEGIIHQEVRRGAYSPKAILDIPEHMHTLAMAYFSAGKTASGEKSFYVADSALGILNEYNGTRGMQANAPLIVSADLFLLLNDAFLTPEVDIGMQYGGGLAPGAKLYSGVNAPLRPCPGLSTTTVKIPNSYYEAKRTGVARSGSASSAVDLSGDLSAWVVNADDEASTDATPGQKVSCSIFPTDKKEITLDPKEDGGFESFVEDAHLMRTNGRGMPPEWKTLRNSLSS